MAIPQLYSYSTTSLLISVYHMPLSPTMVHTSKKNQMMSKLHVKLGFRHENSSPYYPQGNGQVESINKVLKTMIQRMVGENKTSWHLQLFSSLWAYRTSVKTSTGFTPFHLVYGIEAMSYLSSAKFRHSN
jgi:transposase InsO family protein